jgi:phosphate transport system substrate-binding protein
MPLSELPIGQVIPVLLNRQSITRTGLRSVFTLFLCSALLLIGCGKKNDKTAAINRSTIQVKGSDTMVNVAQAWAEEYANVAPDVDVEVSGGGSGVGIAALEKGAIDIANASRGIKPKEAELVKTNTGKEVKEFVVGFDALAIYVHSSNPIKVITIEQLRQIFAEGGTITKWSQLGITIPGARSDKIIRVSRQSSSGTYEFFRERALEKTDFKLGSLDMNGSKEVVELVGSTRTSIGYSGMGYATDKIRMIAIKTSDGTFAPTVENTQSKAYPLARSLLMYTVGEPGGVKKKYIDWILSAAGQQILKDNGYVPMSKSVTN